MAEIVINKDMMVDEVMHAGTHTRTWDGTDVRGQRVSSGMYIARMITADRTQTRRLVLLK